MAHARKSCGEPLISVTEVMGHIAVVGISGRSISTHDLVPPVARSWPRLQSYS
jgi:hypothetical protein